MKLDRFLNRQDKFIFENKTFRFAIISQSILIIFLVFIILFKIDSQKTVVMPPFLTLKEFWIAGNEVSTSYLEMVADGISYNILNIAPERKPNTEFLYAMTPSEHFEQVKSAVDAQIKYIQNNAITQVFYTTSYNTSRKGILQVSGILKQYIGDKKTDSSLHTLTIGYTIKGGRFLIKGIDLKKEGIKSNNEGE